MPPRCTRIPARRGRRARPRHRDDSAVVDERQPAPRLSPGRNAVVLVVIELPRLGQSAERDVELAVGPLAGLTRRRSTPSVSWSPLPGRDRRRRSRARCRSLLPHAQHPRRGGRTRRTPPRMRPRPRPRSPSRPDSSMLAPMLVRLRCTRRGARATGAAVVGSLEGAGLPSIREHEGGQGRRGALHQPPRHCVMWVGCRQDCRAARAVALAGRCRCPSSVGRRRAERAGKDGGSGRVHGAQAARGAKTFETNCTGCHREPGGTAPSWPANGSPVLRRRDAADRVHDHQDDDAAQRPRNVDRRRVRGHRGPPAEDQQLRRRDERAGRHGPAGDQDSRTVGQPGSGAGAGGRLPQLARAVLDVDGCDGPLADARSGAGER